MHWKVRPYLLTGGRTRTRQHLLMHTLVSVPYFDAAFAAELPPESRRLYERARTPCSIAELSAHCGISLGVIRVIVGDLITAEQVRVHQSRYGSEFDRRLLERVRSGLHQLA